MQFELLFQIIIHKTSLYAASFQDVSDDGSAKFSASFNVKKFALNTRLMFGLTPELFHAKTE